MPGCGDPIIGVQAQNRFDLAVNWCYSEGTGLKFREGFRLFYFQAISLVYSMISSVVVHQTDRLSFQAKISHRTVISSVDR